MPQHNIASHVCFFFDGHTVCLGSHHRTLNTLWSLIPQTRLMPESRNSNNLSVSSCPIVDKSFCAARHMRETGIVLPHLPVLMSAHVILSKDDSFLTMSLQNTSLPTFSQPQLPSWQIVFICQTIVCDSKTSGSSILRGFFFVGGVTERSGFFLLLTTDRLMLMEKYWCNTQPSTREKLPCHRVHLRKALAELYAMAPPCASNR